MTRANPDNPDCFAGWNMIVPHGSTVSLISAFLFLYILYDQLTTPLQAKANPWAVPAFFEPNIPFSSTQTASTLEWLVSSPPAFHHFHELPISS
jgi:heme/copper-type cytochrome/quinol oxidase subunit 1